MLSLNLALVLKLFVVIIYGGKLLSLRSFFNDNGVIFQHFCVYTPQQNGVLERKHRHILQVARALKFQAKILTQFWGDCALHAVHIINRVPTPVLSFKTLFEHLHHVCKLENYFMVSRKHHGPGINVSLLIYLTWASSHHLQIPLCLFGTLEPHVPIFCFMLMISSSQEIMLKIFSLSRMSFGENLI